MHVGAAHVPQEREVRGGGGELFPIGGRDEPQPEFGVLGVTEAAARLQPRRTLGHVEPGERERHDGGQQRDERGPRVIEQRSDHVHGQHAQRRVDDGPGRRPRREALGAVHARRHGHQAHEHAGQHPAHHEVGRRRAADGQRPTDGAHHVAEQHGAARPERVHHALGHQTADRSAESRQTSW